ncbi:MAG TPA: 3-dehydroquinate synthase [Chryseosolibacter sp.]|nr:3-dehydroquinate synthase [Chryseosolibacter sp.]
MPDNILHSSKPADDLHSFLQTKAYSNIFVVADQNTYQYCYPVLAPALLHAKIHAIEPGEEAKNLRTCEGVWQFLTNEQADRHSVLIVVGGGVLGDLAGFCAATYKRGIDFILIPTTLLSQVDASIGGKLGVDFNNYKNHIGVFQHPVLTLIHDGFLRTLPPREMLSGFTEIIKHNLIATKNYWRELKSTAFNDLDWRKLIEHSVEFKHEVVTSDPKEKGLRKILNAGHTIGHGIETHLLNTERKITHGEAVAAGLITEAYISYQRKLLPENHFNDINNVIIRHFGKINIGESDDKTIASLMLQDKKNKGNRILCVLLENIGKARWDCEISTEEVLSALAFYRRV